MKGIDAQQNMLTGFNNVMVDLETMGNGSNAAIIAIGAVRFNEAITARFYKVVSLQSSLEAGLEITAGTVMWWMQQSYQARAQFNGAKISLGKALIAFSRWVGEDPVVWGNGATSDNVILSNAYKACILKRPWSYKADRCYRTLRNMRPDIEPVYTGVAHRAVDDAESQALHLIRILSSKD